MPTIARKIDSAYFQRFHVLRLVPVTFTFKREHKTMNMQCQANHRHALPHITLLPRYEPLIRPIAQRPITNGPRSTVRKLLASSPAQPEEDCLQSLTVAQFQIHHCEPIPSELCLCSAFLPGCEAHRGSNIRLRMRTVELDEVTPRIFFRNASPLDDQEGEETSQVNVSTTMPPRKMRRIAAHPLEGCSPILLTDAVVPVNNGSPSTGHRFRIVDATPATPSPSAYSTAISLSPPSLIAHEDGAPDNDYYHFATDAMIESENFPDDILLPIF